MSRAAALLLDFAGTIRGIAVKITRAPLEVMKRRLTMCDALSAAVRIYNATPSQRTGFAPDQINSANYAAYQLKLEQNRLAKLDAYLSKHPSRSLPSQPGFQIGDLVRRQLAGINWDDEIEQRRKTSQFRKEYSRLKWSVSLYRVSHILPTSPVPSYRLESLDGRSYPGSFTANHLLLVHSSS
jgi:hypothetical protein